MAEEYSEGELERILDRVHRWGVEFSESAHFAALSEEQKGESEAVVMFFTECMYNYVGLAPEEWDEDGVEECCLEVLPRKISADEPFFRAASPVLAAFFRFLAEKRYLRRASRLAGAVQSMDLSLIHI